MRGGFVLDLIAAIRQVRFYRGVAVDVVIGSLPADGLAVFAYQGNLVFFTVVVQF